jgi:hypothetical protein
MTLSLLDMLAVLVAEPQSDRAKERRERSKASRHSQGGKRRAKPGGDGPRGSIKKLNSRA